MTCRHKSSSNAKHEERLKEGLRPISPWQTERSGLLHPLFTRVESGMQEGRSLNDALGKFHYYWRGERYRSDSSKRVRFSLSTLRRLFYQWRKHGRTPEALALRFNQSNRSPVKSHHIRRFIRMAARTDVSTFAATYARLGKTSFSIHQIWRVLPGDLRQALRAVFYGRRQQRGRETRFARFLAQGGWR